MKARENPFTVQRILEIPYQPQEATWPALLEKLEAMSYQGAIVGSHGSGKTTMIETLQKRLAEQDLPAPLFRLNEARPRLEPQHWQQLAGCHPNTILLLDGAEQLPWWRWPAFLRKLRRTGCQRLVITVHRASRLPTWYHCRTSPELLAQLIARLSGTTVQDVLPLSEALYRRHAGNLRDALREMYDRCAADP